MALYLAICAAPAVVVYVVQQRSGSAIGTATYGAEVLTVLPIATVLLAVVLAAEGILREREDGMWPALSLMAASGAAYLGRRFLALALLVAGLSLAPLAVALGLGAAAGAPPPDWSAFAYPWLLQVLPAGVAAAALALGICTMADGVVAGVVQGSLAAVALAAVVNVVLAPAARHLGSPESWLALDRLEQRVGLYRFAAQGIVPPALPATEGGFDAAAAAGQWLTPASLALAAGLLALGAAANYLRRSQRDLPPWRSSPTHPLRSLIALANRWRVRYAPDARPAWPDRAAVIAGAVAVAAALALFGWRDGRLRREAAVRYAVETTGWPGATPAALLPTRWSVEGALTGGGELAVTIAAGFANSGQQPIERVALVFNPFLAAAPLGATRDAVRIEQRWDRLVMRLTPPLGGGEERLLRLAVAGRPAALRFALPGPSLSFFTRWKVLQTHRRAHELTDLSASYRLAAISARRIQLDAGDLLPVPRYTSWQLEPPGSDTALVPPEGVLRDVDLTVDLAAPTGTFLADSCGHWCVPGGRLLGRCRTVLNDYTVRGAHAVPAWSPPLSSSSASSSSPPSQPVPVFAVLPQHRAIGSRYAPSLAAMAAALPHAWPGLSESLAHPVLLEWSPPFDLDPWKGMSPWLGRDAGEPLPDLEAAGALLLVPESLVGRNDPLPPNRIVAGVVSSALLKRRRLADGQRFAIVSLVRSLVARHLGAGPPGGAVLNIPGWEVSAMEIALLERKSWTYFTWAEKVDALAADLAARVGDGALVRGLDAFLAPAATDGTMEELVAQLERASGASLAAFYRDYCVNGSLPQLRLSGVKARRRGAGWVIEGQVENRGTGDALCPLVLETDLDRVEKAVHVEGSGKTPFTLESGRAPRSLQLDPHQVCHRYRALTPVAETVDFGEGG